MYVVMNVALGNYQVDSTNQYLCGYEPISSWTEQVRNVKYSGRCINDLLQRSVL